MQISSCRQEETILSDNFKGNLKYVQLFILKWKMIKHHFNMILLELLCILAFNYVFIIDKNPQENP